MALRKEWTEWHLTPRGWERGSTRVNGHGNKWVDEPEDRVLSFVYIETGSSTEELGALTGGGEETWRSKTAGNIGQLLQEFGPCPQRL